MIFLFTDFGTADIYVGQVKATLALAAPGIPVIDLLNEVTAFDVAPAAHLLAALSGYLPPRAVTLAVVDPGVGTDRRPIALCCEDRWFVGPDNGLLAVVAARSAKPAVWEIGWRPDALSRSFHARDLFAPVAARIASEALASGDLQPRAALDVRADGGDLWQVIHVDHYGNLFTGIRQASIDESIVLVIGGASVHHAGIFAEAIDERPFWYVNSIGLVEIACNRASAAERLGISAGEHVTRRAG